MHRLGSLIVKSGLRNRRRSALTIASTAASLCLLGILMAMYGALFYGGDETPAQALRLITHHKVGLADAMPVSYRDKIRSLAGVRDAMVWQWFGGTYKDARDQRNFFARFAVEPDRFFRIRPEIVISGDAKRAFENGRTACIATEKLARKFGWKTGERITLVGDIFPVTLELTLAGTYTDPENSEALFFSQDYLRESLPVGNSQRDQAGAFQVQAMSAADVVKVAREIDAAFDNSPAPTKTESERAFQLSFVSFLGNLKLFLAAVSGAIAFTLLLVSGNTISMSVRERVGEVGILKTLGFTPGMILGMILGESAVISGIGGGMGVALAAVICVGLRQGAGGFANLQTMAVTPAVAALAMGTAVLIGLVSSVGPAVSASRTSILESLRYTG